MPPPSLDDIRMFAAVVEAGGFRPAAQRLGLPASTVSDVVRRLEDRLGLRLLNRSTRGVMPTDAGRRLLGGVGPAFDLINEAVGALHDDEASPRGPLRLSVAGIAARYVLPRILPDFISRHPDVRVEVVVDDNVVDIIEGGFDAAIRYQERVAGDMIAVPIGPPVQRLVAAAAPAYLERHGEPRHPNALTEHRLIGHRLPSGVMVVWEFEQGRRTLRVTPSGPLITPSIELRVAAAVAGCGLIYTFADVLRPQLEAGALVPVLEPWWQSFSGPVLCYHGARHTPAPLRAFVAHVGAQDQALWAT
ncbi:MAG: LysR family transcriptional regulator [Caulobacteraceae bacterium]|nr:LysR family transcriptional regulator [Caulobacteraceae bacterium]